MKHPYISLVSREDLYNKYRAQHTAYLRSAFRGHDVDGFTLRMAMLKHLYATLYKTGEER